MTHAAGRVGGPIRPALDGLVPYEPGKPVETVQRELGLERVVKLASNEGPFGPFPEAIEAIHRALPEANRYPDGGCYRLREALAERHDVRFEEVVVAAGADAVIGYVCQALLDPGDEIVTPWPSFPSYVIDPLKLAAVPVRVDLADGRVDVDALLAAVTERTKIAFLPTVNNPTGPALTAGELERFVDEVPDGVVTVVDEAYFEYVDDPAFPDAIASAVRERAAGAGTADLLQDLRARRAADRLRRRPCRRDRRDPQGAAGVRRDDARAGGRAREPRRAGGARAAPRGQPRGDGGARGGPARPGLRADRAGGGQLPVRRRRRGCRRPQRRAPPARRDRPADGRRSAPRPRCGSPRARPTRSRSSRSSSPRSPRAERAEGRPAAGRITAGESGAWGTVSRSGAAPRLFSPCGPH